MKKIISLFLTLMLVACVIALVSCDKEKDGGFKIDESKLPEGTVVLDDVPPSGEKPLAPGASLPLARGSLTLAKDAVLEDGKLVLYFNEALNCYEFTECYIGVIKTFEGDSIPATLDFESHTDMALEDGGYRGVTLVPKEELSKGECKISVTIGSYVVETFDFVIE